jgi:CYTH domain-containing protein
MPTENERKFVLINDREIEKRLAQAPDVTRSLIVQAYLDSPGVRIRAIETGGEVRRVFTFKQPVAEEVVEIETDIEPADFARLWKVRRETLQKVRYSWPAGRFRWDVDFFKSTKGDTYFALAEVEMPEHEQRVPPAPPSLAPYVLALVVQGDPRFSSKRLANRIHAERLLKELTAKGKAA